MSQFDTANISEVYVTRTIIIWTQNDVNLTSNVKNQIFVGMKNNSYIV